MPTYDYQCDACGETWEMFQKITDDPIKKCPSCGCQKARRLFGTGAAVVFKGSGFYQTDYRSESYRKAEKAAQDETSKKSDGNTAKSDTSAATTTEKKSPPAETSSESKPKKRRKND